MRLDTLKAAPDRAGRYWAVFDDGSRLGLYRQTVEDFGLYPGRELSPEDYQALQEAAQRMSARMRAVRIVSMTSVSRQELRDRLIRKGDSPEQAEQAVAWMAEMGLLDDLATARSLARSCAEKGYGLARARQTLYQKRIPRQLWDAALEDYPDQGEAIERFLRARLTADADAREVRRAVDALLRRGHSYGDVRQALKALSLEPEEQWEE